MSPAILIGFALLAVAFGCSIYLRKARARLERMQSVEVSSVEHLEALAQSMKEGLGESGLLRFATEIRGAVTSEQPLISELAQQPCVYYSMRVTREYEETYWDTDNEGNRVRRTRRGSQVMAENERRIPFSVADATGALQIDPDGADIVAEKALSEFRQESGHQVQVGGFRLPVSYGGGTGARTLGYRFEEKIIPIGREIYILGEATDTGGRLTLCRPDDGSTFLVSTKGEAQLSKELTGQIKVLRLSMIGSSVLGILLLLGGLL